MPETSSSAAPAATGNLAPAPATAARAAGLRFVLIAGAAFATSGPLARYARPAHPLVLAFGRVALAAVFFVLLDVRGLWRTFSGLPRRTRLGVAGAGALLAAHFAFFQLGLEYTSLAAAISLVSLEPLSVVLCAWLIHGIAPTGYERVGVLIATVGAALVARAAGDGDSRLAGDLFIVGAVIVYGLYVNCARFFRESLPPRHYATLLYVVAALALLPSAIFHADAPLPAHAILAIVILAAVPTLIGHTAVQYAARYSSPSLVALVSPAETLGALVLSILFLGAKPTAWEGGGALVILAGVTVAVLSPAAAATGNAAAEFEKGN